MVDFLIIGGGIAGLSAAIRLTELGATPTLIEAGDYPAHKVCGEFFSPSSVATLNKWEIHPVEVPSVNFHTPAAFTFAFPTAAGSLSHLQCDPQLVQRAKAGGALIKTQTKVTHLDLEKRQVTLDSGEVLQARQLILSSGRLTHAKPRMRYMGIKAHFEGFSNHDTLEMFSFPGAYFGISPIEKGKFNVACLATLEKVNGSPEKLMETLLSGGKRLFPWMTVKIPEFGVKETPYFPNCYFVGDAAGTIPPATGNGLSMALSGGIMAAEYAFRGDAAGFRSAWRARYSSQIMWGKLFHYAMMRPWLLNGLFKISHAFPIPQALYKLLS